MFVQSTGVFRHNQLFDNLFVGLGVAITGNYLLGPVTILGNQFGANPAAPLALYPGISVDELGRAEILGNRFQDYQGSSSIAIFYLGYNALISGNTFSSLTAFGPHASVIAVYNNHITLTDNVFRNIVTENWAAANLSGGRPALSVTVEGNLFENTRAPNGASLRIQGYRGVVQNNVFRNGRSPFSGAILLASPAGVNIVYNVFEACTCDADWGYTSACVNPYVQEGFEAHYNIFRHNYPEVYDARVPGSADFTYNYWGDPSGPYHPILNPNGQGDACGDNVVFDPWLTDSIFSSTEDRFPALPSSASLTFFPNPFNANARFQISVSIPGHYELRLFDVMGRETARLWEGLVVGSREVDIRSGGSSPDLPSGVYFACLTLAGSSQPAAVTKIAHVK